MKLTSILVCLSIPFFIVACASSSRSSRYASDFPLRAEKFYAHDSAFSGRIPEGWFSSADDSLTPGLAAWLIRDDFSATIAVREMILDQQTLRSVKKEGLELLARITMRLNGNRGRVGAPDAPQPKAFEMKGRTLCGYEVSDDSPSDSLLTRIVLFELKGRYYECEAKPSKGKWTKEDVLILFTTQQTILSTFSY